MKILGIETSCDETSAAVVDGNGRILSNVISSQIELHRPYGGVVPEIAARHHVELLPRVVTDAIFSAGIDWGDVDAVAATYGPGLASSLLIGVSFAKALALRLNVNFCVVNHMEAHILSVFIGTDFFDNLSSVTPFLALVVSGGHTALVRVKSVGDYKLVGETLDDAAGEAFDKGAKLLGLEYPGGPAIDAIARNGDPHKIKFPIGPSRINRQSGKFIYSFSGIKTSLLYYLRSHPIKDEYNRNDVAASYQEAIAESLIRGCEAMHRKGENIAAAGGVSLNSCLRAKLQNFADKRRIKLFLPSAGLSADNAAMVAGLACLGRGIWGKTAMDMDVDPNLPVPG